MKIGITGQTGFVGTHLYNRLGLNPEKYERVEFEDRFFEDTALLRRFVSQCDVIIHLAAMNRHENPQKIYDTNVNLVKELTGAMEAENVKPHVIFTSSTQESLNNLYGDSKRHGRELFEKWAERTGADFTALIVPNVYGEFARPNYNTFIATFAHKLIRGESPTVINDSEVNLIYVGSLCDFIMEQFEQRGVRSIEVPRDMVMKVSSMLSLFEQFAELYLKAGIIPELPDRNTINLFNTFRSYIDYRTHFPVRLNVNSDSRGDFVETIKMKTGGQVSFSTTVPGVTRGNHFHIRKVERFTVIRGKASIELRRIGSDEVLRFELDGSHPAYVDMPVWYTHNITNTGSEELYTQFWINELYNPADGDTYFEKV